MNKTPLEIMQKRYEQVRTLCLRYADLHESSTAVCHQALGIAKHSDHLAVELAAVLDDAMLALLASEEQRKKLEQQLRDVDSTVALSERPTEAGASVGHDHLTTVCPSMSVARPGYSGHQCNNCGRFDDDRLWSAPCPFNTDKKWNADREQYLSAQRAVSRPTEPPASEGARDARRYRWLRENGCGIEGKFGDEWNANELLDAAIDAAMTGDR